MAAFSTKGLTVWLQKKAATGTAAPVTVTGITSAKPAVVSVGAGDIAKFKPDELVTIAGTNSELDGNVYQVGTVTANSFPLVGSDLVGHTPVITAGTATPISTDMVEFCVSVLDYTQPPAQAITVGTTCDPSAQIAGEPQAGTVAAQGFVDFTKAGYLELLQAIKDGIPRVMEIRLPTTAVASGGGKIIYPSVTAAGRSESYGVNAAAAWTAEFTLGTSPTYDLV